VDMRVLSEIYEESFRRSSTSGTKFIFGVSKLPGLKCRTFFKMKCHARNPPGDEIYRDGAISIFEVDGRRNKVKRINSCRILTIQELIDHFFVDLLPKPMFAFKNVLGP
jgi:hypothetical protein